MIQAEVLLALAPMALLFRNNRGKARRRGGKTIEFGLFAGAGDLIGLISSGPRTGTFLSVEVKSRTGRPSRAQIDWADMIRRWGGVALIVSSAEEARLLLQLETMTITRPL